jgi:hypothetical protein
MRTPQQLYIVLGLVLLSMTTGAVAWQASHSKTIYPGDSVTVTCGAYEDEQDCCDNELSLGGFCDCED